MSVAERPYSDEQETVDILDRYFCFWPNSDSHFIADCQSELAVRFEIGNTGCVFRDTQPILD